MTTPQPKSKTALLELADAYLGGLREQVDEASLDMITHGTRRNWTARALAQEKRDAYQKALCDFQPLLNAICKL